MNMRANMGETKHVDLFGAKCHESKVFQEQGSALTCVMLLAKLVKPLRLLLISTSYYTLQDRGESQAASQIQWGQLRE